VTDKDVHGKGYNTDSVFSPIHKCLRVKVCTICANWRCSFNLLPTHYVLTRLRTQLFHDGLGFLVPLILKSLVNWLASPPLSPSPSSPPPVPPSYGEGVAFETDGASEGPELATWFWHAREVVWEVLQVCEKR